MNLADFKSSFRNPSGLVQLNNAGLAPTSHAVRDRAVYWAERLMTEGEFCEEEYLASIEQSRRSLASLVGCQPSELAFFLSTANAISQMAFGVKIKAGDEVVTWDQEYGSNLYPWRAACMRSGANLKVLASGENLATPIEKLLEAITPKTRVVAISWVQFQTGAVADLPPIVAKAHAVGAWVIVDVMQGLGQLPFHFQDSGVDAVCGGSHKWLCGPLGVGFLALKHSRLTEIDPQMVGAQTYGSCDDPTSLTCEPKENADRYEPGSRQVIEIAGLGAAADLILGVGVVSIQKEIAHLSDRLRHGIMEMGLKVYSPQKAPVSSIVNFEGSTELYQKLWAANVSVAKRGPGLRFSPHAFNTDAEIDTALDVIYSHIGRARRNH